MPAARQRPWRRVRALTESALAVSLLREINKELPKIGSAGIDRGLVDAETPAVEGPDGRFDGNWTIQIAGPPKP